MYRIVETEDGFVVVNDRTDVHEGEVFANLECAEDFMNDLAWLYCSLCQICGS